MVYNSSYIKNKQKNKTKSGKKESMDAFKDYLL